MQPKQIADTPNNIRLKSLVFMLVALFTLMPVGHILWAVMMKQYTKRLTVPSACVSWLMGIYLVAYGGAIMFGDSSNRYLSYMIPGAIIFLAPFFYTFISPLPSKR